MSFYSEVNTCLRPSRYLAGMPGSPKGQPKPIKRELDRGFAKRLREAMRDKRLSNADLARLAECERATIGNYVRGKNKLIEPFLLFSIADALEVSPRWLLMGPPAPRTPQGTPAVSRKAALLPA